MQPQKFLWKKYLKRGRWPMATVIRPKISVKNKYWIDKHRHYELKHFCLQYPEWKKAYNTQLAIVPSSSILESSTSRGQTSDNTATLAIKRAHYAQKINLIERIAKETDETLYTYILKAVTEGLSFPYLQSQLNIPCGKDMYYDRYRKFFWLLSEARN